MFGEKRECLCVVTENALLMVEVYPAYFDPNSKSRAEGARRQKTANGDVGTGAATNGYGNGYTNEHVND